MTSRAPQHQFIRFPLKTDFYSPQSTIVSASLRPMDTSEGRIAMNNLEHLNDNSGQIVGNTMWPNGQVILGNNIPSTTFLPVVTYGPFPHQVGRGGKPMPLFARFEAQTGNGQPVFVVFRHRLATEFETGLPYLGTYSFPGIAALTPSPERWGWTQVATTDPTILTIKTGSDGTQVIAPNQLFMTVSRSFYGDDPGSVSTTPTRSTASFTPTKNVYGNYDIAPPDQANVFLSFVDVFVIKPSGGTVSTFTLWNTTIQEIPYTQGGNS